MHFCMYTSQKFVDTQTSHPYVGFFLSIPFEIQSFCYYNNLHSAGKALCYTLDCGGDGLCSFGQMTMSEVEPQHKKAC